MGNTSQAVDTLERLAVQLAGITDAAVQLRQIGSVEGALAAMNAQLQDVTAQLETAKTAVREAQATATEATAQAARTGAAAKMLATSIVAQATTDAARLTSDATENAAKSLDADRAARADQLKVVNGKIATAEQRLADLETKALAKATEVLVSEKRVADAATALEAIQLQARKMVGA